MTKFMTINAGSSSIKFGLFDDEKSIAKGLIERMPNNPYAKIETPNKEIKENIKADNYEEGLRWIFSKLTELNIVKDLKEIEFVGHRVVHGGDFSSTVEITPKVIDKIKENIDLAPLHNPANLAAIDAAMKLLPTKHFAIFDTAFHQSMGNRHYLYPLPKELQKLRRYGFHGTSHKYVYNKACEILSKKEMNAITIHLGNGCSIAAIKNGKTVHTSMGLTPLEGLMMGTRSGDIDPGIVLRIAKNGVEDADRVLNKKSGFLGITGMNDLRDIMKKAGFYSMSAKEISEQMKKDSFNIEDEVERSRLSLLMFADRIIKYVSWYINLVNPDAIIFTGGIGENAWQIRKLVCSGIHRDINDKENEKNATIISDSEPKIMVIPTNEELQMVREIKTLINNN